MTSGSAGAHPSDVFMSLAEVVYRHSTYDDIHAAITRTAVEVIPGCDHACVTVMRSGAEPQTLGATDDIAATVDAFERQVGEGPCLDAIMEQSFQLDTDIERHSTWPKLSRLVLEHTPVRGMLGYRLFVGERKAGALNIFSDTAGALDAKAADLGAIVAAFASTALGAASQREHADNLLKALHSNREIGKAVGLLMATHGIGEEQAFDTLKRSSMDLNVRLADLARRVIDDPGVLHRGS
ncbi:MAG TPA: GAF and ANTAR domain-containing protein [Actinomycetales bacterium]|nr:GAF and ANTAR domain-containing protein [Actinomycetales bacterium]